MNFHGLMIALPLIGRCQSLRLVRSCSKCRSLAGLRVGYALGPAGLIADLSAVRNSFNPYNLDRLAQAAGAAAMRDVEYFKRCTGAVIATRERIKQALTDLGCVQTDSKANFLFVKLPNVSGPTAQKKLRERGVLVRRFDTPSIRDYLRVTVGSDEQMDAFLTAVKAIIEEGE
ncbi:MAG: aminotransferase class I/II-fold pyridoxal phosphate-dependent enzyme [Clostridia bacterium]|nr:aminotransferase class I/II-fold pyridoxal phosphate-dependent enzyme [Clostridia bacterium]